MSEKRWFLSRDGLVKCPSCHAHVQFERGDGPQTCTFCASPITARALAGPASRASVGARGALVAASLFGLSVGAALGCASGPDPAADPAADPAPTTQPDDSGADEPADDGGDDQTTPEPEPADPVAPIAEYGAPAEPMPPPGDSPGGDVPEGSTEPTPGTQPEPEFGPQDPPVVALYGAAPSPGGGQVIPTPTVTTNVVELRTTDDGEMRIVLDNIGLTVGSRGTLVGTDVFIEVLSCEDDETCEGRLLGEAAPVVGQAVVFGVVRE